MINTVNGWNRTVDISPILRHWDEHEDVKALSNSMSLIIRDEIITPLEARIDALGTGVKVNNLLDELYKWEDMEDYFKITSENGNHQDTVYHMEELYELGDAYGVWFEQNENR